LSYIIPKKNNNYHILILPSILFKKDNLICKN